jgi:hypothetical protein
MTAYRLDLENQKMSRDQIRQFFSQAHYLHDPTSSSGPDLRRALKIRVDEAIAEDPQYIEVELELANIYGSLITAIEDRQQDGRIGADVEIPLMHSAKASMAFRCKLHSWQIVSHCREVSNFYTALAAEHNLDDYLIALEDHLRHRKTVHKSVRTRLTHHVKEKIAKEQKEALKINKSKARRHLPGKGFEPQAIIQRGTTRALESATQAAVATLDAEPIDLIDDDDEEEEEEAPLDIDAIDMHQHSGDGREEPICWQGLGEDIMIRVDRDDNEESETSDAVDTIQRNKFLLAWANKANSIVPNSNLKCALCLSDDTQPESAKNTTYSLAKLNIHLGSGTHSRRSQLLRAFSIEAKSREASTIQCPICGLGNTGRGSPSSKFIAHIEEQHPEELWDSDAEQDEQTRILEASGAEGEDTLVASEDQDPFEAGLSDSERSAPLYTGKGKGKAAVRNRE